MFQRTLRTPLTCAQGAFIAGGYGGLKMHRTSKTASKERRCNTVTVIPIRPSVAQRLPDRHGAGVHHLWHRRTPSPMALPALEGLQGDLVGMGGLPGCVIERSVEALERLDESAAREVIQDIAEISQWRSLVEERAVELIATRMPTAREAQRLVAVLDI